MERLNNTVFSLDSRIFSGYYSDKYFCRTKEILEKDKHNPIVVMQIFQRNDNACICGIDEAITILREGLGESAKLLEIHALHDGDIANAWETIMTIEGPYNLFAHLETVYLGALARGTKVATNVYRCFKEANEKPILFFPARFDSYLVQAKDGYSFDIGRKAANSKHGGVSTDAQGSWWGSEGLGTIPHALIAAYYGDTVEATMKFSEYMPSEIKRVALVDFENDCVRTANSVAVKMFYQYYKSNMKDERFKLHAVRLDTSGSMVDRSISEKMDDREFIGSFKPTGVNPMLVQLVRNRLDDLSAKYGCEYFEEIKIVVSGGFDHEKIKEFESKKVPVDMYGVGSSMFNGNFDFTADIVLIKQDDNNQYQDCSKKGRRYNKNSRLSLVKEQT